MLCICYPKFNRFKFSPNPTKTLLPIGLSTLIPKTSRKRLQIKFLTKRSLNIFLIPNPTKNIVHVFKSKIIVSMQRIYIDLYCCYAKVIRFFKIQNLKENIDTCICLLLIITNSTGFIRIL